MPKITFMGAGSTVFAKNVLGDSMMTPRWPRAPLRFTTSTRSACRIPG